MTKTSKLLDIIKAITQPYMVGCASFLFSISVFANPVLNNVAAGQVTIQQTPNSTVIQQTSQKAIINWQSFNIGAPETTAFQQPAGGIALNRINPTQGPSAIYGRLTATGQIILVNPAGIFFGPGSFVNVGGLIASTVNISDQDFLNGYYHFSNVPGYNGAIINQGKIIAANNGLVALIGGSVRNDGMIQADLGHVVLASGDTFTMTFAANDLVGFTVDDGTTQQAIDQNGNQLSDGVKNTGTISANGGSILISAKSAAGVLDHVINMEGIVQAQSVYKQNGKIIISGDPHAGVVRVAGNVNAAGKQPGNSGGKITITGYNILLDGLAKIDVSGHTGGGTVNIGGDAQGKGSLPNANAVIMEAGAHIFADALSNGNGGNIVLWSDNYTNVNGVISSRGGSQSGHGGYVETSSKNILNVGDISVDTTAPFGSTGNWLLDPSDLTISAAADANVTASNPFSPLTQASNSFLSVTTLTTALATSNVTVQTGAGAGPGSGDILIPTTTSLSWSSAFSLTLSAFHNITASGTATISNTGGGSLVLQADNTGTGSGTVAFGTGNVALSGGSGTVSIFYNPGTFGTPTASFYTGGTAPVAYQLINQLGSATDSVGGTNSRSLATLSNSSSIWGQNFALAKNIDATATSSWNSGAGFVPIGLGTSVATEFTGKFNGQNFVINNLYINRPTTNYVGLFGANGGSGTTISNVGLSNVNITGQYAVGGMIGFNGNGAFIPGGSGNYPGNSTTNISNVYVTGSVTSFYPGSYNYVGGIVGYNTSGTISNTYSTATVNATGLGNGVGGFVGQNYGNITNSYATGNVNMLTASVAAVGGFAGENYYGTISQSYSTGTITVANGSNEIGGFIGTIASSNIGGATNLTTNNYTTSSIITSNSNNVGGFVGRIANVPDLGAGPGISISNAYSSGTMTGTGNTSVGGFFGVINNTTGTPINISKVFWDTGTSGITPTAGYGSITGGNNTITNLNAGCFGSCSPLTITNASNAGVGVTPKDLSSYSVISSIWGTATGAAAGGITNAASTGSTAPNYTWFIFSPATGTGYTRPMLMMENQSSVMNAHQLQMMGAALGASYVQNNNLDLTNAFNNASDVWGTNRNTSTGNGFYVVGNGAAQFTGSLNGQNYSISNFYEVQPNAAESQIGLFGQTSGATFSNINLANAYIRLNYDTFAGGILAGRTLAGTTISNSTTSGLITFGVSGSPVGGYARMGGMTGENQGTIINSYTTADVSAYQSSNTFINVGGFTGNNIGTISTSYSAGNVFYSGGSFNSGRQVGGFNGANFGTINTSYSIASVTIGGSASSNLYVGGFAGQNNSGPISNSYSSGLVTNTIGGFTGGFTGQNSSTFANNFYDTQTSGQGATAVGTGSAANVTGKTTTEMMTQSTFTTGGWSGTAGVSGSITNVASTTATVPNYTWFIFEGKTRPLLMMEQKSNITNAHQLQMMGSTLGGNYTLANSLDLTTALNSTYSTSDVWNTKSSTPTGSGFYPIGGAGTFTGTFNGQNYTISNLYINRTTTSNIGLFSQASGAANISNLALTGLSVSGASNVGGLVGSMNAGVINNVSVAGNIKGTTSNIGGLAGVNAGTITGNTYVTGNVTATGTGSEIGGLVGENWGNITATSVGQIYYGGGTVSETGAGGSLVGGLIGWNRGGLLSKVFTANTATVTALSQAYVGGLIGQNDATVADSYSAATVNGGTYVTGGLIGFDYGSISGNTYATGNVNGTQFVGGLVGAWQGGAISAATQGLIYATGNVTGTWEVGGLIGENYASLNNVSYTNHTGGVSAPGASYVGGLVGLTFAPVSNSYADVSGATISGDSQVGGLLGGSAGAVSGNSYATGNVTGSGSQIGGLIGYSVAAVTATAQGQIYASGTVTGTGGVGNDSIGGMVGYNDGGSSLTNVTYSNVISAPNYANVGGIAGYNAGTITNAYNLLNITGRTNVGGIVGNAAGGSISNVYNTGTVTTVTGSAGGIAGAMSNATLNKVYNTGSVVNDGTQAAPSGFGGIVGTSGANSIITNAYNSGYVTGNLNGKAGTSVGGMIGSATFGASSTLGFLYNIGYVVGTSSTGGLIGNVVSGTPTYSGTSYWNSDTSGQAVGVSNLSNANIISANTAAMQTQSNYTSWDFASTWSIIPGVSYPYLQAFYSATPRIITTAPTLSLTGGLQTNLYVNNVLKDNVTTGANGAAYFMEGTNLISGINNSVADSSLLFLDLYNASSVANAIAIAPTSGGQMGVGNGLALINNTVTAGLASTTSSLTNNILGTALGSLSGSNILYAVDGSNNLTLISGASFQTLTPTTYTLNANVTATNGNITLAGPVTLATNSQIITNTTGNLNISGNITGAGFGLTINTNTTGATNLISGIISGSGTTLTKSGADTLVLTNANTYSGITTISAGTLQIGNGGATGTLGTNSVTDNGNLVFNRSDTGYSVSNPISGTGNVIQAGTGMTTLASSNTFTGTTTVSSGILNLASAGALGNGTLNTSSVLVNNGAELDIANIILTATPALTLSGTGTGTHGALYATGAGTVGVNPVFGGAITLAGNTTIGTALPTGAQMILTNTINGTSNGGQALTLSGTSDFTLNNAVGNLVNKALSSLTANVLVNLAGGSVNTTGTQNYNAGLKILNNTLLTGSTISATDIWNFTTPVRNALTIAGNFILTSEMVTHIVMGPNDYGRISVFHVTGTSSIHTGVTTEQDQIYDQAVTLSSDAAITSNTGSITFNGSIDGAHDLTVNSAVVTYFKGVVGGGTPLASLYAQANGQTYITTSAITTVGQQTYFTPQTDLQNQSTVTLTGSTIKFDGATPSLVYKTSATPTALIINGDLDLNATMNTSAPNQLASLYVSGATTFESTVSGSNGTTDSQTYVGPVSSLSNKNVFIGSSSGNIVFGSTVNTGGFFAANASTGSVTYNDNVSVGTLWSIGTSNINAASLTANSGDMRFFNNVTLMKDTTLQSTPGNMIFAGKIDGGYNLNVNATAGIVTLSDTVGTSPLNSLNIHANEIDKNANVTTSGSQIYTGPIKITQLSGGNQFTSVNSDITTNSDITSPASGSTGLLLMTAGGNIHINGNILVDPTPLVAFSGYQIGLNANGNIYLNTPTINGGSNRPFYFNGDVVLQQNVTLTGNNVSSAASYFDKSVTGPYDLTVNAAATNIGSTPALFFDGDVNVKSITINNGSTYFYNQNGSFATQNIQTAGNQYYGNKSVLRNDVMATAGGTITFNGPIDGSYTGTTSYSLATDATATNFNSYIGFPAFNVYALQDLTVTGTANFASGVAGNGFPGGPAVYVLGTQTYNNNLNLNNIGNLAFNGTSVTFNGNVTSATTASNITIPGNLIIGATGSIGQGAGSALNSITVTGTTNGANNVTTTNNQNYNGAYTVSGNSVLTSTAGDITFGSTVDSCAASGTCVGGPFGLTINAAGLLNINGDIGTNTALSSFSVTGSTAMNGLTRTINTTALQNYSGPVSINTQAFLTVTNPTGAITFGNTVDGPGELRINSGYIAYDSRSVTFNGSVGTTNPLDLLDSNIPTIMNGLNMAGFAVNTNGLEQSYSGGTMTLGGDVIFDGGSGYVSLYQQILGAHSITVSTSGIVNLTNAGTTATPLTSITVTTPDSIVTQGSRITSGNQLYNGPVDAQGHSRFASVNGNITFNSTLNMNTGIQVNQPSQLATPGGGAVTFNGSVSGLTLATEQLRVSGTTININGGSMMFTGSLLYNVGFASGSVVLGADTSLTSTSGNVIVGGAINGNNHSLTINNAGAGSSVDGVISHLSALTKNGNGTLTLFANSTYSGDTTISAGTLQLGTTNAIPTLSNVVVNGTLDLAGFNESIDGLSGTGTIDNVSAGGTATLSIGGNNSSVTFDGTIQNSSGAVAINKAGSGTLILTHTNTHNGGTTLFAGTLGVTDNNALGSGLLTLNSGLFQANAEGLIISNAISLGGASNISNNGHNFTLSGTIDGGNALTLSGAGITTLSGNIGNGTPLASVNAISTVVINGPGIATSGNQTYANISGGNNFTLLGTGNSAHQFTINGITANTINVNAANTSSNNSLFLNTNDNQNYQINGSSTGFITGIATVSNFNFSNINNLNGSSGNDSFTLLPGGTLSGGINGGGGTNTLTAGDVTNIWNINTNNGGTVTGIGANFANIQNLNGGNSGNSFNFTEGVSISGIVNGGSLANNSINFDQVTSRLTLTLSMPLSHEINAGIVSYYTNSAVLANFTSIQNSMGNGLGYILLPNDPNIRLYDLVSETLSGTIGDPFYFTEWNVGNPPVLSNSGGAIVNPAVAAILQQPPTNANNNQDYRGPTGGTGQYDAPVINRTYIEPLLNTTTLKAGPACYSAQQ